MSSENLRVENRVTRGGVSYTNIQNIGADGVASKGRENATALAAAKTGQLTTRTDDDTGELTMTAGHGITTGQRLDVYWDGGSRRGLTVGTVSTNQVPIDGGAGDALPANLTNVRAQVPAEEALPATGNNCQWIVGKSSRRGIIVLADSGDNELLGFEVDANESYHWWIGNGVTNPIAADTVAKVFFSNGDSANTNGVRVELGLN